MEYEIQKTSLDKLKLTLENAFKIVEKPGNDLEFYFLIPLAILSLIIIQPECFVM